jgi:4-hydroxy-tetrahydrodipicolinate synthase
MLKLVSMSPTATLPPVGLQDTIAMPSLPSKTGFAGVYPMLYSFFTADGRLDRPAMRRQIEGCLAAGAHGIAILGIASEVAKLSGAERLRLLDWVATDLAGRVPLAVTVAEPNLPEQIAFARTAGAAGADWLILQPPAVRGAPEAELIAFLGAVADACEVPVALQNNPVNLDVWLSDAGLKTLVEAHPNIRLLKAEGPLLGVCRMIEATAGRADVFGGLAGKEITSLLRAGCVGVIPAPDCVDVHVRIYQAMANGDEGEAERLYKQILPLITFVNASVEQYLCYGKRLVAKRLGLGEVHPRAPAIRPTAFGEAVALRYAAGLGPLGAPAT